MFKGALACEGRWLFGDHGAAAEAASRVRFPGHRSLSRSTWARGLKHYLLINYSYNKVNQMCIFFPAPSVRIEQVF